MKRQSLFITALCVLALAGCQKDGIENENGCVKAVVRLAPSIASIGADNGQTKSDTGCGNQAELSLSSPDGSLALPMTCEIIEGIDKGSASSQAPDSIATKGALVNDPGSEIGEVKPLGDFASTIANTFWVTAWDNASTPTRIIPDATARAFTGGYVAGNDANGWYQKVMYRESSTIGSYWMTMQPQSGSADPADDEYIWKKDESKTFYAYANLPESGASITNTSAAGQTLTYDVPATAVGQTDILMGFYNGNGKTGPVGSQKMTGTAGIVFSHPLTAVKFKLGTLSGVSTFVVNSISIENVHSSGTAEMTPASADESDPKDRFTWTPTGTTTVSQNIGTQPTSTSPAIGVAFLLIPQTFASTSTARIKISCTIDGKTVDLYQKLTSGSWKAGYTNEYTVGIDCSDNEALTGLFSVNSTKKVVFSKGNLQYQAATGAWRFAEKQYDVIGNVAGNTTLDPSTRSTQSAWIDQFSWGATGRTDINPFLAQPYYNSTQSFDFKTIETAADGETLTRENGGDWGVCMGSDWRTLSAVEWRYLFGNSTERSGKYNSAVTVCGLTNCIVLAPDNYTGEIADSYDVSTWSTAEASGLVCLPSNGSLSNANDILEVVNEGTRSFYWSSTGYLNHYAYCLAAADGKLFALDYFNSVRCASHSVRLVKDAN